MYHFQLFAVAFAVLVVSGCVRKPAAESNAKDQTSASTTAPFQAALPEKSFVEFGQPDEVDLSEKAVSAFRVQSFGDTTYNLHVAKSDQASSFTVYLEGPLANNGDTGEVGKGNPLQVRYKVPVGSKEFVGDIDLQAKGAYRLIFVPDASANTGKIQVVATCQKNCEDASIPSNEFIKTFVGNPQKRAFVNGIVEGYIDANVKDVLAAAALKKTWQDNLTAIDQGRAIATEFPKVSMAQLAEARAVFGKSEEFKVTAALDNSSKDFEGKKFDDILGPCTGTREFPVVVDTRFDDIKRGEIPDLSLTACEAFHSPKVAKLLNALSEGELRRETGGANLTILGPSGEKIQTPEQLFHMLFTTGHRVVLQNVRQYANFLAMVSENKLVRWPIWVNTQVKLHSGEEIEVPFPHSEQSWVVQGPKYNFRVRFFLGTDGIGFVPLTGLRPVWGGVRMGYRLKSENDTDKGLILKSLFYATKYYSRIKRESKLANGQSMRTDGYGILGVCNDSNALVELATMGSITTYPLLRSAEFQNAPTRVPLKDGLEDFIKKIPMDADLVVGQTPTAAMELDIKRRIVLSTPLSLEKLEANFSAKLRKQIEAAQKETGVQ